MSITETITLHARHFIEVAGYPGAAALMALESMIFPIPSEAVMPFVGMAVKRGDMNLGLAIAATSLGSLAGSLVSYAIGTLAGTRGGKAFVMKVGKYLFINEHHLDLTIDWFHKKGGVWTVFVARFIPVIRHFSSIPAGMGKMPLLAFSVASLIGATMWNGFLLFLGYQWENHIEELSKYYKILDVLVVVLGVIGVAAWIYMHMKKPAAKEAVNEASTK